MGLMDLLKTSDPMEKFYAAAEKSNVPQGGVTGAAFKAMFPHGLGNLAFGKDPEPMPDMASPHGTAMLAELVQNVVGPGTFIGPKGLARLFGDDAAKGMLATAESKLASGVPRESVFQELGVFKGPEGKWRYEIDDSGAKISMRDDGYEGRLPSVLGHEDAYAAYPDARKIVASYKNLGSNSGEYSTTNPYTGQEMISVNPLRAKEDTLLHELQHAVQGREGFAAGGSPSQFVQQKEAETARDALSWRNEVLARRKAAPDADLHTLSNFVADEYRKAGAPDWIPPREARELALQPDVLFPQFHQGAEGGFDDLTELVKFYGLDKRTTPYSSRELYERLAGEAESRAVQDRMNMTMPERRASFPQYATRDDLIVRGNGGGGLMAAIGDDWQPLADRIKNIRRNISNAKQEGNAHPVLMRNMNDQIARLEQEILDSGGKVDPKLVGYEWKSKDGEVYSRWDDGAVSKRISDWENKEVSGRSGRDIVHTYFIRGADGTARPFGKQSAIKELVESGVATTPRDAEFMLKKIKEQGR